jgi:hypothetical protein
MTPDYEKDDGHTAVPPDRLATVWPCPPPDDTDDRPHAGWLPAAVARIVTTYTRPGDRVLVLSAPAGDGPTVDGDDSQRGLGRSDDPAEAAWTVARLGRAVHTRTAPTARPSARPGPGSRSGPGLAPAVAPASGARTGPDLDGITDADRFAVAVAVTGPASAGWLDQIAWAGLLAPTGILAVITHSDSRGGWLIDPVVDLTAAAGRAGLALVHRFVLLELPLSQLDQPVSPLPARVVARRVHSDLLLFEPVVHLGPRLGYAGGGR